MFDFLRKKRNANFNQIIANQESQEVSDSYELIQTGVDCILESRKSMGLESSAVHQIAYFVMYTHLLQKIEIITNREKILVLSVFSIHCEKDTGTDCTSIISRLESLYDKCFSGTDFSTALQRYAFCVEKDIDSHSSDHDLSCSIDCVIDNVKFFLKSLQ